MVESQEASLLSFSSLEELLIEQIRQVYLEGRRSPRTIEDAAIKVGFEGDSLQILSRLIYVETSRRDKPKQQKTEYGELLESIEDFNNNKGSLLGIVLELADMYYVLYSSAVMNDKLDDADVRLRIKKVLEIDGLPSDLDDIRRLLSREWEQCIQLFAYVKILVMIDPNNPRNSEKDKITILKQQVDESNKQAIKEYNSFLSRRDQWEIKEITRRVRELQKMIPQLELMIKTIL